MQATRAKQPGTGPGDRCAPREAEASGVHTFVGEGPVGHLYLLDPDCGGPALCATTRHETRRLHLDLEPGDRVVLALESLGGEVALSVEPPDPDAAPPSRARLDDASVVVGDGVLGVQVMYYGGPRARFHAYPWVTASVSAGGRQSSVEVPLTAVEGVGHGLMRAAGLVSTVDRPLEPGDRVEVTLLDARGDDARHPSTCACGADGSTP